MAVSAINAATGLFDPYTRDKASVSKVLQLGLFGKPHFPKGTSLAAQSGSSAATDITNIRKEIRTAQVMLAEMFGRQGADFRGVYDTSDNSALAEAFDLTTLGVTFPAAKLRKIRLRMVSTNNADSFYQEIEQDVWGNDGTTPVLGDARLVKAYMLDAGVYKQMADVTLSTTHDMVEATDDTHSSGLAGGALSSSNSAVTFPPCRALNILGTAISQNTFAAATGNELRLSTIDKAAGTAVLNQIAGDDGAAADAPAGTVHAHLRLWPVAQCKLVLNSNNVEVHIRTTLSDVFRHRIEAYVGPAISNVLSA